MVKAEMTLKYSYPRYLEAKRSVDDRALNRPVMETLQSLIDSRANRGAVRVLELGGGTASMVRRVLDWSILRNAEYTIVDESRDSLAQIPELLRGYCRSSASSVSLEPSRKAGELHLKSADADIRLNLVASDISHYLQSAGGDFDLDKFDLVIAHAVLDLVDVAQVLPLLWQRCNDDAIYWFTINFDGESHFLPALDGDSEIFSAYHESMNRRPGSRYSGRLLFSELQRQGANIAAAGSSDWVVHSSADGYGDDEGYFLHHIVHTIDHELAGHPEIDQELLRDWIGQRHGQIDESKLVYIAHQLDFVGTSPGQTFRD